jgi:serine/threonine protein kinase
VGNEGDIANEVNEMLSFKDHQSDHVIEILRNGSMGPNSKDCFIDMEYCEINLDEYIHGKKTSIHGLPDYVQSIRDGHIPLFTFGLLQEVLSGLIFIHNHGYVHCDLKPQNSTPFHPRH